ncbi:ABC transporter permease [Alloscardovia macacae]|uniref:Transport permease protein n=1 Tax=Alloscardovia macacae TaxID=1160091 RepID=A0A261F4K4_9BIFI|nr:ABC transporter permease [Alloscardovia macacae]OZG54067.1 ABC transporter [Alloscardovia macacae]
MRMMIKKSRIWTSFRIGVRIAVNGMPSLSSWQTAMMRMVVEPLLSTLLYILFSGVLTWEDLAVQHGQASGQQLMEATYAAVFGACAVSTSMAVSEALAWDRFEGTLVYVIFAPKSSLMIWLGRVGALVGITTVSSIVTFFVTVLLVDARSLLSLQYGELLLTLIVSILASCGFAVCVAAVSLLTRDMYTIPNILAAFLPIIGGMIAPMSVFPRVLRSVFGVLPLPHVTDAARAVVLNNANAWVGSLGLTLISGVAWCLLGYVLWRVSLAVQRQRGTLSSLGF